MRRAILILLLAGCDTPDFINMLINNDDMSVEAWWKTTKKLPDARQAAQAASLGDKLFVVGGLDAAGNPLATVDVYDPMSQKWSAAAPLPEPLADANSAVVGERLFVLGAHGYVYDATADHWTPIAPEPAGSERSAAMVAGIDSKIYVAGGLRGEKAVADFSVYDTVADSWTALTPLPEPRDHGAGAAYNGRFYAVGGRQADPANPSPLVYLYDPVAASWSIKTALPTARGDFAVAVVNNTIIVTGGEDASGVLGQSERYTPALDRWSLLAPLPTPRHAVSAALVGGLLYFPGGAGQPGVHPVDVVEALQP